MRPCGGLRGNLVTVKQISGCEKSMAFLAGRCRQRTRCEARPLCRGLCSCIDFESAFLASVLRRLIPKRYWSPWVQRTCMRLRVSLEYRPRQPTSRSMSATQSFRQPLLEKGSSDAGSTISALYAIMVSKIQRGIGWDERQRPEFGVLRHEFNRRVEPERLRESRRGDALLFLSLT